MTRLACALLLLSAGCSSEQVVDECRAQWSKRFDGDGDELAASVALTASGDVLLAGYARAVDFGGARLPEAEGTAFIARLDAGGSARWAKHLARPAWAAWMTVQGDVDDGAIVYGDFEEPLDFGGGVIANGGSTDGFVVKLDAQGQHVFSRSFGGSGLHHGCGVVAARDGGLVVAGTFEGDLVLDDPMASLGEGDVFVARLDASGVVAWSRTFGSTGDDRCSSLATDPQGKVLLAGTFSEAIDFGGGELRRQGDELFDRDLFVAKLTDSGEHLWSLRIGAQDVDSGPRVGASAAGDVVVAGGAGQRVEPFGEAVLGSEEGTLFAVGLDPDGAHRWTRSIAGAGDRALSLAVGRRAIFVAGSKLAVSVATLSLDGALLGTESFVVAADELSFGTADSLTPSQGGGALVAGSFTPAIDFGCGELEAAAGLDLFVAELR